MRGLWLHLLRGRGRAARLEVGLPLAAGVVITFVLLLLLGLQQGLDHRAERTAWRTPEPATVEATAIQAGSTDYVDGDPIAVVDLAALSPQRPDVPGMGDFPEPGEVWLSPALADLTADLPADQLADRFPGEVTRELDRNLLESPDELVAVIGWSPSDPAVTDERPPHQWNEVSSVTPTEIDHWSATPDLYQTTYRDMALLAVVLTALPLVSLGGLAARLMAGRRQRRIATMRLLGATTGQVIRLTITELTVFAGLGAIVGAALHRLLLPLVSQVPMKGDAWFAGDLQPGLLATLATGVAVVGILTLGALTGLLAAVRDPLGTYRRTHRESARARWWAVLFIGAAIVLFWLRSSNPFVSIGFTAIVLLGWGLVSTGPWIIDGLGRLLARVGRRPATFLAGRRLSDSPRGAWRTVGGLALAAFIAGFAAIGLPVGLGNVGQYAATADHLEAVVPASSAEATVDDAEAALRDDGIRADVEASPPPFQLDADQWATLTVTPDGAASELDRARTTLSENHVWGPEMQMAEHLPNMWLVRDGVTVGLLILPIAALVALTSMTIGTIARILDQRDALIALRLVGAPHTVMLAAQRREMLIPTLLLGGIAAIAGLAGGSVLGSASLLNPYTAGIFTGLLALGALALFIADRTARPVLQNVSADLSERE